MGRLWQARAGEGLVESYLYVLGRQGQAWAGEGRLWQAGAGEGRQGQARAGREEQGGQNKKR